jgi:hypothetical protein
MSPHQNAEQNINLKMTNKFLENMEKFKYFGKTIRNQNYIHEQIKNGLICGKPCYHSVQSIPYLLLRSKHTKIKLQDLQN